MLQTHAWLPRSEGSLRLAFLRHGTTTALDVLHQAGVLRARFPKPGAGDGLEAVLVNTAGGLTGGDRLAIDISLAEATSLTVTSAAALAVECSSADAKATGMPRRLLVAGPVGKPCSGLGGVCVLSCS